MVPRHPERFDDVFTLCQQQGFNTVRRTSTHAVETNTQVYLGDTMGEMLTLMGAADICFMGGSLIGDKVGGHNVLEPAALGVPVITGPSYYNFTEIVNLLKKHSFCNIITKVNELSNLIDNHFSLSTNSISLHSANFIANYTNVVNKIVTIIFEKK